MSNRPETCRNKAIECERIARENVATDLALIDLYLELARHWRQMAEQTEDLETTCRSSAGGVTPPVTLTARGPPGDQRPLMIHFRHWAQIAAICIRMY